MEGTMIIMTRLAPGIIEIAVINAATDADVRDAFQNLRQEAGDGHVSVLANVIERTNRAPTIELFYRHISGALADKIDRVAIVGESNDEEVNTISEALRSEVKVFREKPGAIAWLRESGH